MPEQIKIKIIDSHHHLWDLSKFEYPWMPAEEGILRRNYLPSDLEPYILDIGVGGTIVVQADQTIGESEFLLLTASQTSWIYGVVAWVDVRDHNVGNTLDKLSATGPLVGIRHQVEDEVDDDWLIRVETLEGLKEVAKRGLVFDVLVKPRQLKHIKVLSEAVSDLRMVIDHMAKPAIAEGILQPWSEDIATAASFENVYCKVSGLVTEADHTGWSTKDLRPFVNHARDVFGIDRLMWGSDWPVCLLAATYKGVFDAAVNSIGYMDLADRQRFFEGTAKEAYSLDKVC
ncbi:MAG: amidohydrolase family protein [SAR202 cluster bacterium]|nr:amidohydrolase family protein [SAR202 cluster bacterium]